MSIIGKGPLGCSTRVNRGRHLCTNRHIVTYRHVEALVLGMLAEDLMQADRAQAFVRGYNDRLEAEVAAVEAERHRLRGELGRIEGELGRVVTAIGPPGLSDGLEEHLRRLEREKGEIKRRLEALRPLAVGAGMVCAIASGWRRCWRWSATRRGRPRPTRRSARRCSGWCCTRLEQTTPLIGWPDWRASCRRCGE